MRFVAIVMQVYSVSVSPFFGLQTPGPSPQLRGDLSINFSCSPANTHHLIEAAVNEVHRLQACSFPPPPNPSTPHLMSTCCCNVAQSLLKSLLVPHVSYILYAHYPSHSQQTSQNHPYHISKKQIPNQENDPMQQQPCDGHSVHQLNPPLARIELVNQLTNGFENGVVQL